ncbi:polysaccharide pyruvyl transferase family protein [Idiomarina abyssalis]|uniref:polysaccharide pyruvyl transferase family protein n=1 Tax=Idiomarina abyssalis TaxID=86102 RepID=UPI003A8F0403
MGRNIGGGYYGMKNYGDDLFGTVSMLAAREYWINEHFCLMCPPLKGLEADYAVPKWFPENIYGSLNTVGKASRLGLLLKSLKQADRYIFCGGSVFSSSASGTRDILARFNQRGLALSAIGVSIGPFLDVASEKAIKALLQRFEYVALRDHASYEIAKSFGLECPIVLAGDLAGLMPRYFPKMEKHDRSKTCTNKMIAFSPCNMPESPAKSLSYCIDFIKAIVSVKESLSLKVILLNLNGHAVLGDRVLCEYTQQRLQEEYGVESKIVNYSDAGILGIWNIISELDLYISVRLHGAISAFHLNVPFSLVEYHPKCSGFLNDINKRAALRLEEGAERLADIILEHFGNREDLSDMAHQSSNAAILNFSRAPWMNSGR